MKSWNFVSNFFIEKFCLQKKLFSDFPFIEVFERICYEIIEDFERNLFLKFFFSAFAFLFAFGLWDVI